MKKVKLLKINQRKDFKPEGKNYKIITLFASAENEQGKYADIILKVFNDKAAESLPFGEFIELEEQANQRTGQMEYVLPKKTFEKKPFVKSGYSKPEPQLNLNQYLLLCETIYLKAKQINEESAPILFEKMLNNASFWIKQDQALPPATNKQITEMFDSDYLIDKAVDKLDKELDEEIPF